VKEERTEKKDVNNVRYEVVMAATMKITVSWDVTLHTFASYITLLSAWGTYSVKWQDG
jgi:hypothetical protein